MMRARDRECGKEGRKEGRKEGKYFLLLLLNFCQVLKFFLKSVCWVCHFSKDFLKF